MAAKDSPPRPARGRRRPSDVINPTPEERRRDGDEEEKAPVLRKKLKGKGGGKGGTGLGAPLDWDLPSRWKSISRGH